MQAAFTDGWVQHHGALDFCTADTVAADVDDIVPLDPLSNNTRPYHVALRHLSHIALYFHLSMSSHSVRGRRIWWKPGRARVDGQQSIHIVALYHLPFLV